MKRIFIFFAAVLVVATAAAQGDNPWRFTLGTEMGVSSYFNYPRLSLAGGNERSYTAPTAALSLGMRDSSLELGLRYSLTDIRTGVADEDITMRDLSIVVRRSAMVGPRLELFGGVTTGFAIQTNRFSHNGSDIKATQYGISAAFEAGMRYYLKDNMYLSLTARVGGAMMFDRDLGLPSDIDLSKHHGITYAMASICVGFGIGFPPKVKKINMPAALIDHENRYLLASYQ